LKPSIIYGPVSSWRLGRSLGIDPICAAGKVCSFDCVYCSLGRTTEKIVERKIFISTEAVEKSLEKVLPKVKPDVITFSGTGEPTLAKNLGEMIEVVGGLSKLPIAVLTNSSLQFKKEVRRDLVKADIVKGKLDASNAELFARVNQPHKEIAFWKVLKGLKKFRNEFPGKFALEVMFVPHNKEFSADIAEIVREIEPDEVHINTPLRPSPVAPLSREELEEVEKSFRGLDYKLVYKTKKPPKISKVIGKKKIKRLKR